MRHRMMNSFRMTVALVAMGALALAPMLTLSGCGGGTGVTGEPVVGLRVQGTVSDVLERGVSGIRITVLNEQGVALGSVLSGRGGEFFIDLRADARPASVKVDLGNRRGEYHDTLLGYRGKTIAVLDPPKTIVDCSFALPAPQNNRIDLGRITVYSNDSPPPFPSETCP